MSIQILQYEFLGPIPLSEWGPPMEKLVYLILSRTKDKFDMVYVGDCQKTDENLLIQGRPAIEIKILFSPLFYFSMALLD